MRRWRGWSATACTRRTCSTTRSRASRSRSCSRTGPRDSVALALADYRAYDIQLHAVDLAAQYELAQRYQISAYDAAYLQLAAELRAPLATFDPKLAAAAQAHLNGLP